MTLGGLSQGGPRTRTAHEYVRAALRAAILDGQLVAGTRLLQTDLARELGVSTTPVREALRDLVAEGLVFFDAHRGAVVRQLRLEEVREVYELRMVLEPILVQRVVERITDEALDRADALWHRMADEQDASVWVAHNHEFHQIFAEPDADSRLTQMLASLRDSASAYVSMSLAARPEQMATAHEQHGRMLELFRSRDVEGLVKLTVEHLQSTLQAIESEARE